ncbi:membrane hypothetical protein [metagenome]|uniref:Uncharacterized protein n=1 Tax=metagenome TaxID=256318 RepID=A0A2P2BZJ6_9ZZZZ
MAHEDLRSIGGTYYVLRGLLLLPTGFLLIAAGLFNMPPMGNEAVGNSAPYFLVALVLGGLGYLAAHRYYASRFGRVEPQGRMQRRVAVTTVLSAAVMALGITVDFNADLPISLYGVSFACALLTYYWVTIGLRSYHWAFLGGLALLSLLPVWGGFADKTSMAMIPMGVACLGVGWFDHQELVRSFTRLRGVDAHA